MNEDISYTQIILKEDRYGGIIIDASTLPQTLEGFEDSLIRIIADQKAKKVIWITLPIAKSALVPLLTKHHFKFFDCTETSITLYMKLVVDSITPTSTNHIVGVGAFVRDNNDILVIKDNIRKTYKLPGGYIENNENISQALAREVLEETGIKVKLESIVSIGHFSPGQFNESDMYIVCKANPSSKEITIGDHHEIVEAKWVNIDEYLSSDEVRPYDKQLVETAMQNEGIRLEVNASFARKNKQYEFFF